MKTSKRIESFMVFDEIELGIADKADWLLDDKDYVVTFDFWDEFSKPIAKDMVQAPTAKAFGKNFRYLLKGTPPLEVLRVFKVRLLQPAKFVTVGISPWSRHAKEDDRSAELLSGVLLRMTDSKSKRSWVMETS